MSLPNSKGPIVQRSGILEKKIKTTYDLSVKCINCRMKGFPLKSVSYRLLQTDNVIYREAFKNYRMEILLNFETLSHTLHLLKIP